MLRMVATLYFKKFIPIVVGVEYAVLEAVSKIHERRLTRR